jgi:DNA ligase-associated metallophosphoesterase
MAKEMTRSSPKPLKTLSTTPCASFDGPVIRLAGLDMWPDVSGALYIPDYDSLLVADLHFEKGSAQARRGVHLPPYDTRSSLNALRIVIDRYRPQRLFSLGDSFHDGGAGDRLDDADLSAIRQLSTMCDVHWLTGNHDPQAIAGIGGSIADRAMLGPLALHHIPGSSSGPEVSGHLHPVASVTRRGRRLRRKCFVSDDRCLVMPAFGAYAGGLDIHAAPFMQLYGENKRNVWMLGREMVYRVRTSLLIK